MVRANLPHVVWLELRNIYIYIHTHINVFKFSNFFNSHELQGVEGGDDVCAGSGMAMLVTAEFGGGAKMCEDFYFYYFR